MVDAVDIFFDTMMNISMLVTSFVQMVVRLKFIGTDRTSSLDMIFNNTFKGIIGNIGNHFRHYITATLYHSKNNYLAFCATPTRAMVPSTNHSFVNFDMTGQIIIPVNSRHIFSDLMGHAPSSFISNPKLPLQFLGRDTMTGSSEKIHGIKPLLKRGMGVLKWGSRHRVNMVPAPLAHINRLFFKLVKFSVPFAPEAIQLFAKAGFHEVRETGIIIRELLEKLLNCKAVSHGLILRDIKYSIFSPYVKGIIT